MGFFAALRKKSTGRSSRSSTMLPSPTSESLVSRIKGFVLTSEPEPIQPPTHPILNVPTEIVLAIFSFIPTSPVDVSAPIPNFPDCLAVSQVNRYFRRLALSCPELWVELPQQKMSWAKLALERSLSHPISFHAFPKVENGGPDTKIASFSLSNLPRAYDVTVGHIGMDDPADCARAIELLKEHPAPKLESLTVAYGVIDSRALNQEVPTRLRRIALFHSTATVRSPIFKAQITELALTWCSIGIGASSATSKQRPLLTVLASLTHLRRLVLDNAFDDIPPDPAQNRASADNVNCKHADLAKTLEYVRIVGNTVAVSYLLGWLTIPSSATMDIRTAAVVGKPHEPASTVTQRIWSNHFGKSAYTRPSYSHLCIASPPGATELSRSVSIVLSDPLDSTDVARTFAYSSTKKSEDEMNRSPTEGLEPTMQAFHPITPKLKVLEVTHPSLQPLKAGYNWTFNASVWPGLTHIILRGTSSETVEGLFGSLDAPVVFPLLLALEIIQVDISAKERSGTGLTMLERIEKMVRKRGSESLRVVVRECTVDLKEAEELGRTLSKQFEWDGKSVPRPSAEQMPARHAETVNQLFTLPASFITSPVSDES